MASPKAATVCGGADYLLPDPHDDRLRAIATIMRYRPATPVPCPSRPACRRWRSNPQPTVRAHTGMSFPPWRAQLRLQAALIALTAGGITGVVNNAGTTYRYAPQPGP